MILCGVWHGAGYCFIIWGALHGLYLIINNIWQKLNFFKLPKLISWAITFIAIIIGWIFFRAANVITASKIIYYMFANSNIGSFSFDVLIVFMVSLFAILGPNTQEIILQKEGKFYEVRPSMLWALITASLLALSIFKIQQFSPFLYFQF